MEFILRFHRVVITLLCLVSLALVTSLAILVQPTSAITIDVKIKTICKLQLFRSLQVVIYECRRYT